MTATTRFPYVIKAWSIAVVACGLAVAPASAQTSNESSPAVTVTPSVTPAETALPSASPVEHGKVLYPANSVSPAPGTNRSGVETPGMSGLATTFVMLLILCSAGYYFLRRQPGFMVGGKGQRKLMVSESRSLGNRQFLVVVEYESERILLGVTPGKIDYLCPLPVSDSLPKGGPS